MIPRRSSAQHVRAFTTVVAYQKSTAKQQRCDYVSVRLQISQLSRQVRPVRVHEKQMAYSRHSSRVYPQYIAIIGLIFKAQIA